MAFSTDTRTLQAGDTFVAIPGERFDGHDFAADALDKGAAKAIVERSVHGIDPERLHVVPDTTLYLAELASRRVREAGSTIVAITGSIGKTTTKNAIATVLEAAFPVVASEGNLNTLLGLSLTLVNRTFDADTKLVLEMGASRKGDLAEMCEYFRPDISVVTNVRGVHLETFGSLEGVQQAKGELVRALGKGGVACLNRDDALSAPMGDWCAGRTIFFGTQPGCDVMPAHITADLPLLGAHVIYVAMAAFAAGRACGIGPEAINSALHHLKPEKGRLCRLRGRNGSWLIDDSYNASPDAMRSALTVLKELPAARRIAFVGDMLELGPAEVAEHMDVIMEAAAFADQVVVVGPVGQAALARMTGEMQQHVQSFSGAAEAARRIEARQGYIPMEGDVILVKGSQGSRMERISRVLLHKDLNPVEVLPRHTPAWLAI